MSVKKASKPSPVDVCVRVNCDGTVFIPGNVVVEWPRGATEGRVVGGFLFCIRCGTPQVGSESGPLPTIIGHGAGVALREAQKRAETVNQLEANGVGYAQRPVPDRRRTPSAVPRPRLGARQLAEEG